MADKEGVMEQVSNSNPNVVPKGPGGTLGHILRMAVTVVTAGFVYPRSFVEGMDCTALQRETEGDLYINKKKGTAK